MTGAAPSSPAGYAPLDGSWDELLDDTGEVRGEWTFMSRALTEIGVPELLRRQQEARRLLEQDGVIYNVYGDGDGGPPTGWQLDPVPTLIGSREWEAIESGVIERAELLSMILEDLYGPRELLTKKLIPAEVVFGSDGFLRACDGIRLPGAQQLFTYAADIGRDGDGRPVVMADRTQAPSGAGFALENRTVIQRVIPSLYRDSQVHRLAPFFRSLRLALKEVAPVRASEDPRVVVLTPGPLNETAFEHAVLASTLGFPLVEGRDLVVSERRVFMRSVGRLEPVDVILRRVDAVWSDPLELRPDSQLGVPGLVEAARAQTVSIVNTLGSSVLESPALMAFVPRLAEHLLGGPLKLASTPAWWCGEEAGRRHVLANLRELILRPTSPAVAEPTRRGWELSAAQLGQLKQLIEARPGDWVGQQPPPMASSPTLTADGLQPRRSLLRAFAVTRGESYVVMPGGLTRVAPEAHLGRISTQAGATTKDTWVLSSEPEPLTGVWLQPGPAVEAIDPMSSIPSRAAENLWWLGRYAERAEAVTRMLRTVQDRRNEFEGSANPPGVQTLRALLVALTETTGTYPGFAVGVGTDPEQLLERLGDELQTLIGEAGRPGTLAHSVRALLDCAYGVRDQLSGDTWLIVGPLERAITHVGQPGGATERSTRAQSALQEVMRSLLVLSGLGVESMVRDIGWRFMDAGRRLERSLQLLSLLRHTVCNVGGDAADSMMLESVLTSAESIITYRLRYRAGAQLETVLELLLLDPGNPRSLAYQLERLTEDLEVLPRGADLRLPEERRLVLAAHTDLRLAEIGSLVRDQAPVGPITGPPIDGVTATRPRLDAFLLDLHTRLSAAADAVDRAHFVHVTPSFSLVGPAGAEPSIGRAA
ncbi:MAG: circularly permuted type 2 ATP-grasp protein [Solirubrobacteraceae bacterium]